MLKLGFCSKFLLASKHIGLRRLNVCFYHHSQELEEEFPPSEWYEKAYPKFLKLTHILKNVDMNNGRLMNMDENSIVIDDHIDREMNEFKSLGRAFIAAPSMQKQHFSATHSIPNTCFSKPNERESLILNSLTKVSDFLDVSAQQRKSVRLKICPQVTQHHIWRGALVEQLNNLKSEMGVLCSHPITIGVQLGEQIVSNCIQFLTKTMNSSATDSPSWMRLAPTKKADHRPSRRWGDVLEMFGDLAKCLKHEKRLEDHVLKLEGMREGLYQIKDVLIDGDLGYREARHQEFLVQKKLTANLGHSSRCLFTLLLYYLNGSVRDIEVEVRGGVYGRGSGSFCLCVGKVLTSENERMVWSGIKQLDRALGLFKFVWEIAGMKGALELQGHVWCVGAKERLVRYKGNVFLVHGIRLR
ncbi:exosome complex exonuclease [Tasmannia lanceolata]|uniref:exosome complex exonuclease n=1 Tax=Tasmannia lanceolata TaxID=3420 RepID=UPI0040646B34